MNKTLKEIIKNVKDAAAIDNGTKPYDTTATVIRVEGETAWVHIPGGVEETPVAKAINCTAGDVVRVRVSDGKAWITGNDSAPPTDDTAANKAKATADRAKVTAVATAKAVDKQQNYFWHDDNGAHVKGETDGYQTTVDAHGMRVNSPDGTELAFFGVGSNGDSTAIIGAEPEAHQKIDYNGWTFFGPEYWKIAVIKDQRDRTGYAKYSETVTAYSGRNYVTSTHTINKNEATATIEGEPVTVSSVKNKYTVYFEEVFTKDTQVTITYDTADQISSFELGLLASATGAETVAFGASKAKGDRSFAFGLLNESSGKNSFSHGYCTIASGEESHAEGSNTIASGKDSHAEGKSTIAAHWQQHVQGTYNDNLEEDAFEIGNGTSDTNRSNAFRVTKEGDVYNCGDIVPGKITGIANMIYPVGAIYMSVSSTSPSTLFGGKWERIQDRFLLAAGSTYAAGSMDGEATHTLTEAELPNHRHTFTTDSAGSHDHRAGYKRKDAYGKGTVDGQHWNNYNAGEVRTTSAGEHTHTGTTNGAGGAQPHNNMPPYLVVYVWKRTA